MRIISCKNCNLDLEHTGRVAATLQGRRKGAVKTSKWIITVLYKKMLLSISKSSQNREINDAVYQCGVLHNR